MIFTIIPSCLLHLTLVILQENTQEFRYHPYLPPSPSHSWNLTREQTRDSLSSLAVSPSHSRNLTREQKRVSLSSLAVSPSHSRNLTREQKRVWKKMKIVSKLKRIVGPTHTTRSTCTVHCKKQNCHVLNSEQ